MSFHQNAAQEDVLNTVRSALIYGALWAIGSAWSTAIRGVAVSLLPPDSSNSIWAELGAATLVTVFGVFISVLASYNWKTRDVKNAKRPIDTTTMRK